MQQYNRPNSNTKLTSSRVFCCLMLHVFGSNSLVDDLCQHIGLQYRTKQQLSGITRILHFIHHLHHHTVTHSFNDTLNNVYLLKKTLSTYLWICSQHTYILCRLGIQPNEACYSKGKGSLPENMKKRKHKLTRFTWRMADKTKEVRSSDYLLTATGWLQLFSHHFNIWVCFLTALAATPVCLQRFETVGWTSRRASDPWKLSDKALAWISVWTTTTTTTV